MLAAMLTTLRRAAPPVSIALALASSLASGAELPPPAELRVWIEEMKDAPLGPFESVRWFCKDGAVLEPRPYACRDHGGGLQYGVWSPRTVALRDGGYNMSRADWAGVCEECRTASGLFWPIPITLSVDAATADALAPGADVALADPDTGEALATMTVGWPG